MNVQVMCPSKLWLGLNLEAIVNLRATRLAARNQKPDVVSPASSSSSPL
jgi:hypothetical protein